MKNLKKIIAFVLAILMVVTCFTACDGDSKSSRDDDDRKKSSFEDDSDDKDDDKYEDDDDKADVDDVSFTPNVVGLDYKIIEDGSFYSNLNFVVEYEYNPMYDEGVIIAQSPEEGEQLPHNKEIYIVVNRPQGKTLVDVYGYSYESAKQILESSGFTVKYEMVYNTSVVDGSVISTKPERGTALLEGSEVTVYVAIHIDENAIIVPDVVGFTPEDAEAILISVGLEAEVIYTDTAETPGMVVNQIPAPGEKLHRGDIVQVYVSTGK